MTIECITSKFKIWNDNNAFVVTATNKNVAVFKGTAEGAEDFINRHPYGLTKFLAKWYNAILTAPLDLTALDDMCEEMANDENISNAEYCELYAVALSKIQEANT